MNLSGKFIKSKHASTLVDKILIKPKPDSWQTKECFYKTRRKWGSGFIVQQSGPALDTLSLNNSVSCSVSSFSVKFEFSFIGSPFFLTVLVCVLG